MAYEIKISKRQKKKLRKIAERDKKLNTELMKMQEKLLRTYLSMSQRDQKRWAKKLGLDLSNEDN